jgi:hypothetical protein
MVVESRTSRDYKSQKSPSTTLSMINSKERSSLLRNDEAILMRTLIAIVVRLLRRLKKPFRNDDSSKGHIKNLHTRFDLFLNHKITES